MTSADHDGGHASCDISPVVPAVTGSILDDDITRSERHLGAIVEFESDRAGKNDVVVDARRSVHSRIGRIGPRQQSPIDEVVEIVSLRGQLHDRKTGPTGGWKSGSYGWTNPAVRELRRIISSPEEGRG